MVGRNLTADLTEMPQQKWLAIRILRRSTAEETRMLYTAVSLSLFGAAYAFLVSLTIF